MSKKAGVLGIDLGTSSVKMLLKYEDGASVKIREGYEENTPSGWWKAVKTDELDIVAVDHAKQNYILGECKYKNSVLSSSDVKNMKQKFHPKKKGFTLYYWLFSKSGYEKEVAEAADEQALQLVTLDEIVGGI